MDWSGVDVDSKLVEQVLDDIVINKTAPSSEPPKYRRRVDYVLTTHTGIYTFFLCTEGYFWVEVKLNQDPDPQILVCTDSITKISQIIEELDKKIRVY